MTPGYYWVTVSGIVADRGGILDEPMGEPQIGRWDGLHWFLTGVSGSLADQFTVELVTKDPLGLENSEELEHVRGEAGSTGFERDFWYETAFGLVEIIARYPGINYTENALKRVEKSLTRGADPNDPAREAAKLLLDRYCQRVERFSSELAKEYVETVGQRIRRDISTPRRYPLGIEPVKVEGEQS